uniref:Uncharacterized protein n=1 Tax=viral metagenome TaxID=1070528 RepID=A0A6C0EUZ6_9ZZZZ
MSQKITINQVVTTYPVENMDLNEVFKSLNKDTKHTQTLDPNKYYKSLTSQILVKKKEIEYTLTQNNFNGPLSEKDIETINKNTEVEPSKKYTIPEYQQYRYITYNVICNKLFENNIQYLDSINIDSVFIFPTFDTSNKGKDMLNSKYIPFYSKIFDDIKEPSQINISINNCFLELKVFSTRNESKDDYKSRIKNNFSDIQNGIIEYNKTTQTSKERDPTRSRPFITKIFVILDTDKKSLFTGIYNKILSKEKKDILYSEYEIFCKNNVFVLKSIVDSGINITAPIINKTLIQFKKTNKASISLDTDNLNTIILELNDKYKQETDIEYKKSLSVADNIKKMYIYYRLNNLDKIIENKIKTGSKILYNLTYKPNQTEITHKGYFTLVSEERKTYKFMCTSKHGTEAKTKDEENMDRMITNTLGNKEEKEEEPITQEECNIIVKIKYSFNQIYFTSLTPGKSYKGIIVEVGNKILSDNFKWFKHKDLDASLEEKKEIKYYEDILFDTNTLIEYLKNEKKYTETTNIGYEFLKINTSLDLIKYCDFIHSKFKNNIIEKDEFKFFNPLKRTFTVNDIQNNILKIIFQPNNAIYIQNIAKTEKQKTTSTKDNYKIIDYKPFTFSEKAFTKEFCPVIEKEGKKEGTKEGTKIKEPQCYKIVKDFVFSLKEFNKTKTNDPTDDEIKPFIKCAVVNITKENIKDIDQLKAKGECKTKKNNIFLKYKKIFSNVSEKVAPFFINPYAGGTRNKNRNKMFKLKLKTRRLKAKRYK